MRKEELQPALLDRLSDNRAMSASQLQDAVKRDLTWLLNTVRLEHANTPLDAYPHAAKSVVNYGIPELCGHTLSNADIPTMEKWLRSAIRQFEPRIIPSTLAVRVELDETKMNHNRLTFEIRGDLWTYPVAMEMLIRTEVDLETGDVTIS